MTAFGYPVEILDADDDNGTMPENVAALAQEVVGHRIVLVERVGSGLLLTLDNATRVRLTDGSDCCAYTGVEDMLVHLDRIEHVITGVGTTDGYTTWHIYADLGDVVELSVDWSPGNPFYYGYGFTITVEPDVIVVSESAPRQSLSTGEADHD